MKKIVAIAAFFALLQGTTFSQETDLRLGFQVSPALSWMSTDDSQINGNGSNLGLKLGVRSEIFFRENYAFLLGLGFSFNSGGTLLHDEGGEYWKDTELPNGVLPFFPAGTDLKYQIQYVDIPFGLKFRTNEIGYVRYYVELPVITLSFKSQAKGTVQYSSINEDKIDIKKEVAPLALSWGLGAGVEYSVNEGTSLIAGLGYQRVFTDVTDDHGELDSKAGISAIVLQLGVMF